MTTIKNLPKHERPREKMIESGAVNLRSSELLAILLRSGYAGKNVIEVAREILKKFPMKKLLAMSYEDLVKVKGIDSGKACSLLASFELVKRALEVEDNNLPLINCVKDAVAHLQDIRMAKKEHFAVLYLNARNQLVAKEIISIGTLNASLVHPREVFKPAFELPAAGIIIAHNHPSGGCEPSEADIELTKRLKEAGKILGIEVIDHIIITSNSFRAIF
jgi:DNA repair protein RadC